jgi:hypothetical protein
MLNEFIPLDPFLKTLNSTYKRQSGNQEQISGLNLILGRAKSSSRSYFQLC